MAPPAKPIDRLREAPIVLPALACLALFVAWAASDAGYPLTHWAPGAVFLLALLAVTTWAAPPRLREVPVPIRVAIACFALYTTVSFLSIIWAQVPGDAWEGANRTLLYLLVFTLFSLWPMRGPPAALLLCAWLLAMIALAVYVLLHVDSASSPTALFSEGRLKYPAGYENAAAACWCMALWPALLLASARRLWPLLRGVLAGGAVLLGDLALLSQSRGSLFATAAMLVLVFALLPGRVRTFLVLVPVAVAIGLTAPTVLHVGDRLLHGGNVRSALHAATAATFIAMLAAGLIVGLGAAVERRALLSEHVAANLRRAVATTGVLVLVGLLAGGWVAAGNPVKRVEHGWQTFKGGYSANNAHVNRLFSGLGSGRYDFYRVALDEFLAHPLIGIGADNFQQQYLAHGREGQTPHYPHSVELRTLVQTGLVGSLLAVAGLAAALLAAIRVARGSRARRVDPLAQTVAAAALAGFAYWLVHGSVDWFWEFAGLGAPAFALLGLACALAPRRRVVRRRPVRWRPVAIGAGGVLALAAAASLVAPWLSQVQVQNAAKVWSTAPRAAYADLERAAGENPLSDEPYLLAGSIALRFDDLSRADGEFSRALQRTPTDTYALLELGSIASARGQRQRALTLLRRARRLNPHDELTQIVLKDVGEGFRIDIEGVSRAILLKARQLA
ncbi:MAG TPA: O-antigen ligase family protein [Solirubrobacteraceae bacterium]|nr:O-antigen ligase family protein [Solirubrobacteraceae bacterium]